MTTVEKFLDYVAILICQTIQMETFKRQLETEL